MEPVRSHEIMLEFRDHGLLACHSGKRHVYDFVILLLSASTLSKFNFLPKVLFHAKISFVSQITELH